MLVLGFLVAGFLPQAAFAQSSASASANSPMHLRSLAVYEYLGSYQKPSRSRLVPVAIWDGSEFQPGSLYLANPEPLSVQSGTLYELMQDGNGVGQVEVMQAEQLANGWIGLGKYVPNPPSGPKLNLPASLTAKAKFQSFTPHFAYKPPANTGVAGAKTAPNSAGPANDGSGAESGRPTLHQRPEISSGPTASSTETPAEEGRPTLNQPQASSQPAPPTLHHRTEAQQLNARQPAIVSGRPILTYNSNASSPVVNLKQDALTGLPPQMQQMVAISDPDGTSDHSYAWEWSTPEDKATALHKLEVLALQYLTPPKPSGSPQAVLSKRGESALHKRAVKAAQSTLPLQITLTDEHFRAFQLDWGAGAVYVFSARTSAQEQTTTYITLIAQPDFAGGLITLYKSVTPANLLDYQPRMKLIDAVDATGSGRADLLFALLTRTGRQFALFSVQNGQAQEVFHTGRQ